MNKSVIEDLEEIKKIINNKSTYLENKWNELYLETCQYLGIDTLKKNEFINDITRNITTKLNRLSIRYGVIGYY